MQVQLLWKTPNAEEQILRIARVSSNNRDSPNTNLIRYLIENEHWSPFEMANFCIEVEAERAITRQILRHRSFNFQEYSQRYAFSRDLTISEARRQDLKNRQNSIDDLPQNIKDEWILRQNAINNKVLDSYDWAIANGIAKECARVVLPEGNTKTIMCINGTIRSWIHYLKLRCGNGTQKEHQELAEKIKALFCEHFPVVAKAVF